MPNQIRAAVKARAWAMALLWAALVWGAGSEAMSASSTSRFLEPLLNWLLPGLDPSQRQAFLGLIRKSAHVVEYGILALLVMRALWLSWAGTFRLRSATTFAALALLAIADEWRQGLLATRTGSSFDVALDLAGGLLAIASFRLWERTANSRLQPGARDG